MKIYRFFLVLLCFVVSQNSFAQDPVLFEEIWVLESLTIDGEQFLPPSNEEIEYIELYFQEESPGGPYIFDTYVCNGFFGNVTFEDGGNGMNPSLSIGEYSMTLIFCDFSENEIFENQYFTFYVYSEAAMNPFEYVITLLDDSVTLEIVSSNGDIAFYRNSSLSVSDFEASSFSIYPNPTSDQLYIHANQDDGDYTMTIFDIHGRQLVTTSKKKLGTSPLQIQDWVSGIYLIRIEDQNGVMTTKKFIKN